MSFSQKGIDQLRNYQEHLKMRHPDGDFVVSEALSWFKEHFIKRNGRAALVKTWLLAQYDGAKSWLLVYDHALLLSHCRRPNGSSLTNSRDPTRDDFRSRKLALFKGLSFDTISSTGPNGGKMFICLLEGFSGFGAEYVFFFVLAIIRYSQDPKDCAVIKQNQIYLCDSGAQFFDGTTDVTRTWRFGTPTDEEKQAATGVLRTYRYRHCGVPEWLCHRFVGLTERRSGFPVGYEFFVNTKRCFSELWIPFSIGHGIGQGVGYFLNVPEGPHGIGTRISCNEMPLKKGTTVSNEPGYYADGKFGIRIGNVVIVKEVSDSDKVVGPQALALDEVKRLDDYRAEIWHKVSLLLKNDERALKWLEKECKAI
ncbi:Creatinase/aminopeptidase [Dendrothele bispora CBS 962.96]|uniref:Creatinase/aminopeptidase n=1 Tax=Dendrothele bispora (strain CBS 962.96) TaxID=1314807 RepID=A0A4S8LUS7_DENBC|nr:Creatinase/aminopeptidase [Dendrothele bispora CBS 962.96]